jgi:hypothetical protein
MDEVQDPTLSEEIDRLHPNTVATLSGWKNCFKSPISAKTNSLRKFA